MNYFELLISAMLVLSFIFYLNIYLTNFFEKEISKLDYYNNFLFAKYLANKYLEKDSAFSNGFCNINLTDFDKKIEELIYRYKKGIYIGPTKNLSYGSNAISIERLCRCNNQICKVNIAVW